MIKKYRELPIIIEAMQYVEDSAEIIAEIFDFCGEDMVIAAATSPTRITIKTPEGEMDAKVGSYIIKGVAGEFYPCDPDIFEMTYEEVKE